MGEHLVVAGAVLGLVAVVAALTAGGLLVLAYLHQARLEHHAGLFAAFAPPEDTPAAGSPLVDALDAGSAALRRRALNWTHEALGETATGRSCAAAEVMVLFTFWIVAITGEVTAP